MKEEFPKAKRGKSNLKLVGELREFNSLVWKTKKDGGKSLRDGVAGIEVPKSLKDFEKDLMACHRLE